VIKVKVLNPTSKDWDWRDFLYQGSYTCGAADRVCYVGDGCTGDNDPDCDGIVDKSVCEEDEHCLVNDKCPDVSTLTDEEINLIRDEIAKEFDIKPDSSDCGPRPSVDLLMTCSNELRINKLSNPKVIKAGEVESFTMVLEIREEVKGNFLCTMSVFGFDADGDEIEGVGKDLSIEVV